MGGRTAGLVSRSVAAVIDAATVTVLLLIGAVCLAAARHLFLGGPLTLPSPSRPVTSVAGAVVAVGYLVWGWTSTGRTAGDQVMGLRVVDRSGRRLTLLRAGLRAVLCVLLPAGLLWTPFSRRGASVQDLIVRTTVIYDWPGRTQDG